LKQRKFLNFASHCNICIIVVTWWWNTL